MKALILLGCPEIPAQTPMAVYASNKLTKWVMIQQLQLILQHQN